MIDDLELEGWEQIDTFGNTGIVMALNEQRIVVDKVSGEIIIRY
jgi:hypothetical protein